MSIIDPGPEAIGGASYQRENLSDQDDVNTTGAGHLSGLWYSFKAGKWLATSTPTASATNPTPTFGTFGAGITAVAATTGYNVSDASGVVTTTGVQSAAGAAFTVTYGTPLPTGKLANVDVSLIGGTNVSLPYVSANTNTGFVISTSGTALAAGSLVRWTAQF